MGKPFTLDGHSAQVRFPLYFLVPGARIELARGIASRDFKSLASTHSATQACDQNF